MSKYYTDEFKQKIVELRQKRKPTKEIVSEYKIKLVPLRKTVCKQR